jgi:geranylgeranyl pyrophosphate synthase
MPWQCPQLTVGSTELRSIDDIQDNSKYRRGALAAHEVYGVAQTINAANYVYFEAMQGLHRLESWPQLFLIYNEELLHLHRGQGMELFWRETMQPPSIDEYLRLISNKTGGLFRLALRLMQAMSDCNYEISPLVDVMGLMFQIVDDYKNLKDAKVKSHVHSCPFSFLPPLALIFRKRFMIPTTMGSDRVS